MANPVSMLVLTWLSIMFFQSTPQLSIQLIHRDSPQSPLYNQSISQSEVLTNEVHRSHARVSRLNSISNNINMKVVSSITLEGYGNTYAAEYLLGSDDFKVFAFVSLITNIVWIKCLSSNNKDAKIFKERLSSRSCKRASVDDPACNIFPSGEPYLVTFCKYKYVIDESNEIISEGVVGTDVISFPPWITRSEDMRHPLNIYFGCSYTNPKFDSEVQGVIGFGRGGMALASQLNQSEKFSYCLRPTGRSGTLKFGNIDQNIMQTMSSSPLYLYPFYSYTTSSAYVLNCEGISIGHGNKIETSKPRHLIAIDFGTSMTYLTDSVYIDVENNVKAIMGTESKPSQEFSLCFDDNLSNRKILPGMVFHFANGANVILEPLAVFVEVDADYNLCLAIFPVGGDGISIFGSRSQAGNIIHFDITEDKVYFKGSTDCTLF